MLETLVQNADHKLQAKNQKFEAQLQAMREKYAEGERQLDCTAKHIADM